jgi:hypothetical protein
MGWHFLKSGQTGAAAIDAIDRLMTPLGNSIHQDLDVAVNTYLGWVEQADTQLSSFLDDRRDVEALYTEHYWRIRTMNESTVRPVPLISVEQSAQKTRLQEIRNELQKYSEMAKISAKGSLVVCDTNVYVHGKLFTQLAWDTIVGLSPVRVLVPLVVVDELDAIKDRGSEDSRWTRRVIKEMKGIAPDGTGLGPFQMHQNVTLQFVDEPRGHRRLLRPDDEIVRQAEYFSGLTEGELRIVSLDQGMLFRAQAVGLHHLELPSEFLRKKEEECPPEPTDPSM